MARKIRFSHYLPTISIILVAFALRVAYLEDLAVNPDETRVVIRLADASLEKLVLKYWAANHNLHGLIFRAAASVSEDVFFLRYVTTVVFGVLAIPALFWLTRTLIDRRTALVSVAFLSLSAHHLLNSQILRGYSLLVFLGILLTGVLYRALRTGDLRLWAIFSLLSALNVYNHLFAAFLVSSQGLMAGWFWRHHRARGLPRTVVPAILAFVMVGVLTAALYSPFFSEMSLIAQVDSPWESDIRPFSQVSLSDFLGDYSDATFSDYLGTEGQPYLSLLFFVVAGVGLLRLSGRRPLPSGWLFIWVVAPYWQAIVLLNLIPGFYIGSRFLQYVMPPLLIMLAYGSLYASELRAPESGFFGGAARAAKWTLVLGVGLLFAVVNIGDHVERVRSLTDNNWRQVASYLAQQAGPNDLILCEKYDDSLMLSMPQLRPRPENECTRNLIVRTRSQNRLNFVQPAGIVLDYEFLAKVPWWLLKEQRVWLVRWDIPAEVPVSQPGCFVAQGSKRVDVVSIEGLPLIESLDRVANLLTTFDETSVSQAIHWSQLAQVQVSAGDASAAGASLERADSLAAHNPEFQAYRASIQDVLNRPPLVQYPDETGLWRFADHINLIGYSHQLTQRDGGLALAVTLFWQPTASPTGDYTIFVHLVGENGERLAQVDFRPFDGLYPTNRWQAGDVIWETRILSLPDEIPPQDYTLLVGMYDLQTLERLPVLEENVVDNAIPLFALDSHLVR